MAIIRFGGGENGILRGALTYLRAYNGNAVGEWEMEAVR